MKKILLSIVIFSCLAYSAHSQKTRLNIYGNYAFDDHVNDYYSATDYFDGTVKGGFLYGGGLEFALHEMYSIELMYLRMDTKVPVDYYDHFFNCAKNNDLDLAINYILFGGVRGVHVNPKVEPYGGMMLGVGILDATNPDNGKSSNATKFAWGLRLGTNVWASQSFGIKLQAQLLSITQGAGGGLYFGTGGAGVGVSTYSSMLQFVLGGGLTFKFGH